MTKARIEFCEAEYRQLLQVVTSSQVRLAWASERMDTIQRALRFLHRDLEAQEKQQSGT